MLTRRTVLGFLASLPFASRLGWAAPKPGSFTTFTVATPKGEKLEVIRYSRLMEADEATEVLGYLRGRWGVEVEYRINSSRCG